MTNNGVGTPPLIAWQQTNGKGFSAVFKRKGREDIGWGTVDTADQELHGRLELVPYKYKGTKSNKFDYYAFCGLMDHSVINSRDNAVSVGYYAKSMNLAVTCVTKGIGTLAKDGYDAVVDYGPDTTVGENSTSFSIGGSLGAEAKMAKGLEYGGSGSVDVSWGVSFSSPNIIFTTRRGSNGVNWTCNLPAVGFKTLGIPANPFPPSKGGYKWYPMAIFRVPKGQPCVIEIDVEVRWRYDYTRGITKDKKNWDRKYRYTFDGKQSIREELTLVFDHDHFLADLKAGKAEPNDLMNYTKRAWQIY